MEIENRDVMSTLSALANVRTEKQYAAAKRLVARLGRIEQLAMVDSMKDARRRILGTATSPLPATEGRTP